MDNTHETDEPSGFLSQSMIDEARAFDDSEPDQEQEPDDFEAIGGGW